MASNPSASSQPPSNADWKSRYTDLVNEFDQLEENHASEGIVWNKTITRLSQALHDYSHANSNALQPLTAALAGNPSVADIATAVNDFCMRLPDPESESVLVTQADVESSDDSATYNNQRDPAEFERVLADLCTQLKIELKTTNLILAEGPSPAVKLKILTDAVIDTSDGLTQQTLDPAITALLLRLLDNLPTTPAIEEQFQAVSTRLQACSLIADLPPILEAMTPLVEKIHSSIEQERQQNAAFLNQIWQRLADLGNYLESSNTGFGEARDANHRLQSGIQQQVSHLLSDANTAESLPALRELLGESVEQIRGQVNSYVADEIPRLQLAEEQCQQLTQQVTALQKEAATLKEALEAKQHEANRDPLTNLANRRAFDKFLAKEHSRWQRYKHPLSLVFIDIDWFKRINDQYGHKAGDAALISIARILRNSLREHDFLARYGGEEFIALLPNADLNAAFEVAEKLRHAVMNTRFHFQEQPVQVTISCGISEFVEHNSPQEVLHRADTALYEAKEKGRNQTAIAVN